MLYLLGSLVVCYYYIPGIPIAQGVPITANAGIPHTYARVMSTAATVPMVTKVVAGTAAKGYSDIERATGGVNGNGKEIPRISIRRATLSEACSVTSMVNDAYRHPISLFAVEGCTRVTPDGTQGARAIVCVCLFSSVLLFRCLFWYFRWELNLSVSIWE